MQFLKENASQRARFLSVRGKALPLPIYFPSVSSIKTNSSPFEYFNILKALGQQHFLVSAYDVAKSFKRAEFIDALQRNRENDESIILMDSGNYESFWLRDKEWSPEEFNSILNQEVCDLAFCFDNQNPPSDIKINAHRVASVTQVNQKATKHATIIPIIHSKPNQIIDAVLHLSDQCGNTAVSIPERILGGGILERVKTVTALRKELRKKPNYTTIHILGTGNPYSLLLLSFAGADSFDGLEWCQTTVNADSALLLHFQHRELVADECPYCTAKDLDYTLKTLGHNLTFYREWMKQIQEALATNGEIDMLEKYLSKNVIQKLEIIWA